jgi:hypothetical protein
MVDAERLHALHETYVWEVNAAVGEGRLDLVSQLADDYLEEALRLMSSGEPTGCGRTGCAVCLRPHVAPAPRLRRRAWSFFRSRG